MTDGLGVFGLHDNYGKVVPTSLLRYKPDYHYCPIVVIYKGKFKRNLNKMSCDSDLEIIQTLYTDRLGHCLAGATTTPHSSVDLILQF